ncbi:uncharacterized protein LOC135160874 isoform X2 [Diachasmimorpha longicaudata]|uniref:uncharacterized protein LOC135160874 isoform X2 n=1 Tax=Diachasmimorpha longicaudata TaxID=58733 RepID=UPI0030B90EA0
MKMLVGRLVLAGTVFLLVIGDTTSRSQLREEVASRDRQILEKDAFGDYRQGRMGLHTEPPANKAKREQALRHILAARRRQILTPKWMVSRNPKPSANVSKDSLDMLEGQETRHGVFVTVPMSDQIDEIVEEDGGREIKSSTMQIIETPIENPSIFIPVFSNTTKKDVNVSRNSSIFSRNQKSPDDVSRRKNTVAMPESLYNHFRPVESNIPLEDMTQFLYFGQKIHPENTTGNNSMEMTSVSPTLINSRRRFNPKRYGTTLSSIPKLEDIVNEEMDIGLAKSTIERIKIFKTKNALRNTGIYSRKSPVRPSDPTIVTNVILTNRNKSETEVDSSAHANQLAITDQGKGSLTHWTSGGTDSTQIPQKVQQDNGPESEIIGSDVATTIHPTGELVNDYRNDQSVSSDKQDKYLRNKKNDSIFRIDGVDEVTMKVAYLGERTSTEVNTLVSTTENDKLSRLTKLSTWMSIDQVTTSLSLSTNVPEFNDLASNTSGLSDNPRQQPQSSLRIVVTEPIAEELTSAQYAERNQIPITPVNLTSASITTPNPVSTGEISTLALIKIMNNSSSLIATIPPAVSMHPYTYTITNLTRLLRNYTGPGPNEKTTEVTELKIPESEEGKEKDNDDDDEAGLLPPLSGIVGIEAARASVGASADPAAVETTTLVKEGGRKVTQKENTSRNSTVNAIELDLITEKTVKTTDPSYSHGASIVLWNYTGNANNEREGSGDRRFMRKSASAVLNQRTSEDREFKRRRGDTGSRRVKGLKSEERHLDYRSMDNKTLSDYEVILHNKTGNIDAMGKQLDDQTTLPPFTIHYVPAESNSQQSMLNRTDKTISGDDKLSVTTIPSEYSKFNASMETSTVVTIKASTLRSLGTTMRDESTSTAARPPVFPVTPVILNGLNKITKDELDVPLETDRSKNLEKPFGIDKELDPSEIQKMYRAQSTLKPEATMTTLSPEVTLTEGNLMTSQPKMVKTTQSLMGERSREVRGRNLSDKTKDKDDILPIMQLYNNSNILNETVKNSQEDKSTLATPTSLISDPRTLTSPPPTEAVTVQTPLEDALSNKHYWPVDSKDGIAGNSTRMNKNRQEMNREVEDTTTKWLNTSTSANKTRARPLFYNSGPPEYSGYHPELNASYIESGMIAESPRDVFNVSEVITKRNDGDTLATQETVAIVSYILATLVVFPIAVGVGLILRRLIIRNRKVLEESDTSSEISCRKDALNLENGDFKTSIEKAITKLPRIQHLCHETEKSPSPSSQESRWEFSRDKLRLQTVLGQGNFGQVWKAEADDLTGHQGTTRLVAVKTVKEGASARENEDLVRELEIMQQLGNHPNVVTLLGCCTEEEPHYLILEYVMYGKLLAYLRDHRTRQDFYNFSEDSAALTSRDLTVFGYCVARGMEYLASKKIIHRDLAARNVLVDHNKLCKIADFGMSRFANEDGECIETRHGRNALPIRWMAPESLIYSLFTTKTDVWSFGILMWEIVTLGSTPYPDMAAREVMRNVQNGYRLERPSHCRSELFRVIARCWHADPDRRPEFQTLRRDLAQLLEDNMNGHYVDLESFASECAD